MLFIIVDIRFWEWNSFDDDLPFPLVSIFHFLGPNVFIEKNNVVTAISEEPVIPKLWNSNRPCKSRLDCGKKKKKTVYSQL